MKGRADSIDAFAASGMYAYAETVADLLHGSLGQQVIAAGLADGPAIAEIVATYRALANHPDRFLALSCVEVVARKP